MSTIDDLQILAPPPADGTGRSSRPRRTRAPASYFDAYAEETARAARSVDPAALDRAAAILLEAYTAGRAVFSCGNGGSAVHREPLAVRPREGRPDRHRPVPPGHQPEH